MFFSLASLSLLAAATSVAAMPAPRDSAATETIYMRIEGPTKTVYEQTIQAYAQDTLTVGGNSATCELTSVYSMTWC